VDPAVSAGNQGKGKKDEVMREKVKGKKDEVMREKVKGKKE
jgi:hypothetical protein